MATSTLKMNEMEKTLEENDIVLIDFWAEWCGPCKMFGPVYEKASEKYPDIAFTKVDTENDRELATAFGIQSIPTLAIFREKILIYKQPGALPESGLEDLIKQAKDLDMDEVRKQIKEQEKANVSES